MIPRPLLRMTLLSCFVTCWVGVAALQPGYAQKSNLSYAQVEHLVKLRAPDDLVASQIRSRGISFSVSNKILDELKSAGAGPETVAALRERIRVGKLEVQTTPGSKVLLDGKEVGSAGPGGSLAVADVSEGNHELKADRDGYKEGDVQFSIASNETKSISLPLEWLGGFLSVKAKPDSAKIAISGPKSFEGGSAEVQCPSGSYTVTVSLDGYTPQTRSFQIATGEHHSETFELAVDPAVLLRKLDDARSKLGAGDSAGAEQLANAVLNQSPNNLDAAVIVAEAAFQLGDMNHFVDAGANAIRGGKQVTVRTMHLHQVMSLWIHPVDLTISESGISIVSNPPDSRCKVPPSVGFDLIESALVMRSPQRSFITLHIQYASKPHGAILHDLDFVPDASQIVTTRVPGQIFGNGPANIQEPGNAGQTLDAIRRLLIVAKR
jgi:hypothetical protein